MKAMTEKHLKEAFAGESQAHMKYLAFAAKAEKEGLPNVARLFRAVASAEVKHAHYHLRELEGIGSSLENLKAGFAGEDFEIESMYPAYIAVGDLEGEASSVKGFKYAMAAEEDHRPLYEAAAAQVEAGGDLEATPIYVCGFCGHTGQGEAPEKCPVCGAAKKMFESF